MKGRKTFSKNAKRIVFNKLKLIHGKDPSIWRKDVGGTVICFPSYGDENSRFGWNIHHKNKKPLDNNIINLIAVSYETHEDLH